MKFLINPFWPETHQRVNLGNKISPDDVDLIPDLELSPPSELLDVTAKTKYTLVLSDPDALSRKNPVKSQMCHWIVTNITLPDFISGNGHTLSLPSLLTSKSEEGIVQLKTYFPPAPPPKTGYHRYVFAFLKSNSDDPSLPKAPKERAHWGYGKVRAGIREWAAENDLTVIGKFGPCDVPLVSANVFIAANFFYAQNKKQ